MFLTVNGRVTFITNVNIFNGNRIGLGNKRNIQLKSLLGEYSNLSLHVMNLTRIPLHANNNIARDNLQADVTADTWQFILNSCTHCIFMLNANFEGKALKI